ncbi:5-hydroxyisourate hydrolase [Microtetraspora sp. NBRC 13810]|uniref:hydroxyisourate hydrolase n=1 Tax=Microtetraspora sp. NBRC 13810 TaxID=3030990 RepID=UPI0024A1A837|nr:hydroxyisourate hydrolase [Microtetraspora sp. NBRC 13810]GLW12092.1 5-hydroxyisourate hydrolase [Microtetraspora sp. NBRC 13810]
MSLSTHVLDASAGRPAAGVAVRLEGPAGVIAEGRTDADGRLSGWRPGAGPHRLVFGTGAYFAGRGVDTFYPEVTIGFTVGDPDEHYHVPLLLSPYAYSTYRGS